MPREKPFFERAPSFARGLGFWGLIRRGRWPNAHGVTSAVAEAAEHAPSDPRPLYMVRVAGPGNTSWRVAVRAGDPVAAAVVLSARGHIVLGVEPGRLEKPKNRRPVAKACSNCAYDLRSLPVGSCREVVCPECGVTNLPVEFPQIEALRDRRRDWRLTMMFVKVLVVVIGALLLLAWLG